MRVPSCCLTLLLCCVLERRAARLHIQPNKAQFFWYEPVTLSCEAAGNSSAWAVKMNTSHQTREPCREWGASRQSCNISDAYPSDSGVYWCESESGESSNTINVTVTGDTVILESPALPVTEGDSVALVCHHREAPQHMATKNFSANFYKFGVFIGNTDVVSFSAVSKADEGFYKCEHPTAGESPQSWLAVTSKAAAPPPSVHLLPLPWVTGIVSLIVLFKLILLACVGVCRKWATGGNPLNRRGD